MTHCLILRCLEREKLDVCESTVEMSDNEAKNVTFGLSQQRQPQFITIVTATEAVF